MPQLASSQTPSTPTPAEHQIQLLQLVAGLLVETGDELHDVLLSCHAGLRHRQRPQTAQRSRLQHATQALQRLRIHVFQP